MRSAGSLCKGIVRLALERQTPETRGPVFLNRRIVDTGEPDLQPRGGLENLVQNAMTVGFVDAASPLAVGLAPIET